MEEEFLGTEPEAMQSNGHQEATVVDAATESASEAPLQLGGRREKTMGRQGFSEGSRSIETEPVLLDSEVFIELKNVKSAMVLPPNHAWPLEVEGLLVEHRQMPLGAHTEITMIVGDREVLREEFYLPTHRRDELMEADRKLADVNSEILTNENLRNRAMAVFYPDLADDYDLWYRIAVDEHGLMSYSLHMGPSEHQENKNKIEGTLQL
jgi:hypothetical protein